MPQERDALLFLAGYLKRPQLALARLSIDESGTEPQVVYSKHRDDGVETRKFSPLEFLAELQQHIPDIRLRQSFGGTGLGADHTLLWRLCRTK